MTKSPLLAERLANYAYGLRYEDLPPQAVLESKRRLVDALGCAMGAVACQSQPARIARQLGLLYGSSSPTRSSHTATVLTTQHQSSPDLAAFVSGVMMRYLDFNDTYLSKEPAHPSDNIAAILAVAEAEKRSGRDILTAIVLAYEIQCRLCDAASIRSRGWDHVTYGAFSAGLAAGKLYGLNPQALVHLQGLASTPNNAMRQTRVGELSHWKGCAFANASRNAVFAAMLAKHGMTGPSEIFEGEMGFWAQISGPFEIATMGAEKTDAQKGSNDFMINHTYVKHFPAEYHSQSAIEAALVLREQVKAACGEGWIDAIESITIESFNAAVEIIAGFEEHWHPKTRETADHSMPYCVSAALIDGDITLDTFTDERIQDPKLFTLLQKVKVNRNDEMNAGYPEGIPNRLIIKTKNGQTFTEKNSYPLGHARNPMNDAQIEKKFRAQAGLVLSEARMDSILTALWDIESCQDISIVMAMFADVCP